MEEDDQLMKKLLRRETKRELTYKWRRKNPERWKEYMREYMANRRNNAKT